MQKVPKYPGVYIHIDSHGEKIFYIMYRQGGRTSKLIKEPVGKSSGGMTAARAAIIRADRISGKSLPNTERRFLEEQARCQAAGRMTINKLWELYKEGHADPKRDISKYNKHLKFRFGELLPEDISTPDIERMKYEMSSAGSAPASIQRIIVILRAIINFGVLHGHCHPIDPSKLQFKTMKIDNVKTEVLTDDELARFMTALDNEPDQNAAALLRLALVTGIRKGALLALQWNDCDFDRGIITLRGEVAKKGKTEHIPMSSAARTVLQSIDRTSVFVFPGKDGNQRKDFRRIARRVKERAQLPKDFRPIHGLRHNFASRLASSGQVDMYTLQKLLTHESPLMTQRYAHLADEAMKRASEIGTQALLSTVESVIKKDSAPPPEAQKKDRSRHS
ncbi:tyrosine-type recombinase/integrase [Desulfovibrio desulfuricans]|uniref:tyrosine-type recombinase/integrase n=1 Tax=Desulfovibrio desulfuricans TaxID=876 RepID=UPI0003B6B6F1|nr:site-specific integrase [Desulfovibrio desulfuricans]